jgi:hypothetical protein
MIGNEKEISLYYITKTEGFADIPKTGEIIDHYLYLFFIAKKIFKFVKIYLLLIK